MSPRDVFPQHGPAHVAVASAPTVGVIGAALLTRGLRRIVRQAAAARDTAADVLSSRPEIAAPAIVRHPTRPGLEFAARASREFDPVKVFGSALCSPNFQVESGNSLHLEGGAEVKLPLDVTLGGRVGHPWIDRNPRFGTPDVPNWSVALSREVHAGFILSVGDDDTNIRRVEGGGVQGICDARAMVTLSRSF